jgi:alkylated DNA repair dioxygenase AlkB
MEGLSYHRDVVRNGDELMELLERRQWTNILSRQVQYYGYIYDSSSRNIEVVDPIPQELLLLKLKLENMIPGTIFNQVIVNKYEPGQGISPHIDNPIFGGHIGCFTVGGGCEIIFSKQNQTRNLYVEPDSLYIMSGSTRWEWTHEIKRIRLDNFEGEYIKRQTRISLTFRSL